MLAAPGSGNRPVTPAGRSIVGIPPAPSPPSLPLEPPSPLAPAAPAWPPAVPAPPLLAPFEPAALACPAFPLPEPPPPVALAPAAPPLEPAPSRESLGQLSPQAETDHDSASATRPRRCTSNQLQEGPQVRH